MASELEFVFSKERLNNLKPPAKGRVYYRDLKQSGLQLYLTANGTQTFFVRKRVSGKDERLIIGNHDAISVEQARNKAKIYIGMVTQSIDPKLKEKEEKRQRLTFGELFEAYIGKSGEPDPSFPVQTDPSFSTPFFWINRSSKNVWRS